jgi:hypothetical protein
MNSLVPTIYDTPGIISFLLYCDKLKGFILLEGNDENIILLMVYITTMLINKTQVRQFVHFCMIFMKYPWFRIGILQITHVSVFIYKLNFRNLNCTFALNSSMDGSDLLFF